MIRDKRNLSISMLFGFLLVLGVTAAIQSSTVIPVSAQNTSNLSLTESEPLGIITITAQQLERAREQYERHSPGFGTGKYHTSPWQLDGTRRTGFDPCRGGLAYL